MNILALDTASAILSAAVSGPRGIVYFESDGSPSHSERLMAVIDFLVREAGLEREELNLAACMEGPGSFTGLRIGFAAVKGLSLALGIPFLPVPTLDCMALPHAAWPGPVIPTLDARKGRFFAAVYRQGRRLTDHLDAAPEELAKALESLRQGEAALITGPDAPLLYSRLAPLSGGLVQDPAHRRGRARELLEISREKTILFSGNVFAADDAGPVYLRKSDAELAAPGGAPEGS